MAKRALNKIHIEVDNIFTRRLQVKKQEHWEDQDYEEQGEEEEEKEGKEKKKKKKQKEKKKIYVN